MQEVYSKQMKKDIKLVKKQGKSRQALQDIVDEIKSGKPLDDKYQEHYLTNNYKGCRECHITPDWLLIYRIDKKENKLYLVRTGSHSELYEDFTNLTIKQINLKLSEYLKNS